MAENTNDLYGKAIELSKRSDDEFLELARTLRQLRDTDSDLFRLCIENSHISMRKAQYLVEVEETFNTLQVPETRLQAIGWTKLAVIAKHVTKDNLKDLLKLAETETARDLKAVIGGELSKTKPRCVLLYFTHEQYDEFAEAAVEFGATKSGRGLSGMEGALIHMIQTHKKLLAWCIERFDLEYKAKDH